MVQSRLLLTFTLALVVALAASYLVYQQLNTVTSAEANGAIVLTATRNLEIGSRLTENDLKPMRWPNAAPPAGAVSDPQQAIGRALVFPVFEGELILDSKLAAEGIGAGLGGVISQGMRAVSIRVDEVVAVAGFVVAGTRVDVLLTGVPGSGVGTQAQTQTILEDAQVLAAGQEIQPDAEGKPQRVNVVTLLCTPEDATRVVLAAADGRIQLVLRNPTDRIVQSKSPVVSRAELYSATSTPPRPAPARPRPAPEPPPVVVPEPPPPTTSPVVVIRGTSMSQVEVPFAN
jgi:pilus assembly protein CpaB